MFNLNRCYYNRNEKKIVKHHGNFEFEKTILADRYLLQNQNYIQQVQERVEKLKVRQRLLQEKVNSFKNEDGEQRKLVETLRDAS